MTYCVVDTIREQANKGFNHLPLLASEEGLDGEYLGYEPVTVCVKEDYKLVASCMLHHDIIHMIRDLSFISPATWIKWINKW